MKDIVGRSGHHQRTWPVGCVMGGGRRKVQSFPPICVCPSHPNYETHALDSRSEEEIEGEGCEATADFVKLHSWPALLLLRG